MAQPVVFWLAIAAGAAVVGGVAYAVTRGARGTATPAPAPSAKAVASADAAFIASQNAIRAANAQADAIKAQQDAAAAIAKAALLNTTYALTVNTSSSISLKVGDTIRLAPSPAGTWQWGQFDTTVLALLGTSDGSDLILRAVGANQGIILNVQSATASYDVTIQVLAA
jgi:hypothetical protein